MDTTQMVVTAGIFCMLGGALNYRWLKHTGRLAEYSRQWVWFSTLCGALAAGGFWVLLNFGRAALPDKWARLVPFIVLIGIALASLWKPPHVSDAERKSTRRIQVVIIIGGIILVAFGVRVFWLR